MPENQYESKEKQIIQLFGGTKNIIKLLLKNKFNLTHLQHHKLSKILKKPIPKSISIDIHQKSDDEEDIQINNEDDAENDPILLSDLNENCASNICQFLKRNERKTFSLTSRWFAKICRMKNSLSNPQQNVFLIHRLYHFINQLFQIENIKIDDNLSTFISQSESLFSWINLMTDTNDKYKLRDRKRAISEVICHSGLLSTFSNLLIDTKIIINYPELIKNILFLFSTISEFDKYIYFALNANIIENISVLLKYDANQFISEILILLNTFCSSNITSIATRISRAHVIEPIIAEFGNKSCINMPLSTIIDGLTFIKYWMDDTEAIVYYSSCEIRENNSHIILKNIFPQIINRIKGIIDVQYQNKWIYELEKGDTVIVINNHDPSSSSLFGIEQISELSDTNDTDPMATLIGKFYDDYSWRDQDVIGPSQQISVPLHQIKCITSNHENYTSIYYKIMHLLQIITGSMESYFNRFGGVHYEDSRYETISNGIKYILQTSQTQMLRYDRSQSFLNVLKTDYVFFHEHLSEQIQREFTEVNGNIFSLLYVALNWGDWNENWREDTKYPDKLCQLNWFKQEFYASGDRNIRWDQDTFMMVILLKNFHNDYRSYYSLCEMLKTIKRNLEYKDLKEYNNWNHQYFFKQNGIYYLLQIIKNAMINFNIFGPNEVIEILVLCRDFLVHNFIHLDDYTLFRQQFLKIRHDSDIEEMKEFLNVIWWSILFNVFIQNKTELMVTKSIIHEMDWFIHEYNIDTNFFNNLGTEYLKEILKELQTRNIFTERNTISALQNVLCVI